MTHDTERRTADPRRKRRQGGRPSAEAPSAAALARWEDDGGRLVDVAPRRFGGTASLRAGGSVLLAFESTSPAPRTA
jgi:hypothetical protein